MSKDTEDRDKRTLFSRIRAIRLLPPRDTQFYDQFDQITQLLEEGSNALVELFSSEPVSRQEISVRIEAILTRCNHASERIQDLTISAQQPPFERAEIGEFASRATRILRFINHASNRFVVYEMPTSDKEMRELAAIIHEACRHIVDAVSTLRRGRKVETFARAIDALEEKADGVYHGGLRRRFQEIRTDSTNLAENIFRLSPASVQAADLLPILSAHVDYTRHVAVFFILRQVYAELERAIDACTDLADTLKRMVSTNV